MTPDQVTRRRAIEALRAGVPNRDVVRHMPPAEEDLAEAYRGLLGATAPDSGAAKATRGLLLEGNFGDGKSYWLEYFRHLALEQHCICSHVVISKETPLHDLRKFYRAAVESAEAPDRVGPALQEVGLAFSMEQAREPGELADWMRQPGVDPRLLATLQLLDSSSDTDLRHRVLDEWSGNPLKVSDLKAGLRQCGIPTVGIGAADTVPLAQRFDFLGRFFRAAGYSGWIILVDETEMVSRYSLRQRARSYANLALLLNLTRATLPALASVFTITPDYGSEVLEGRRDDLHKIPEKLPGTRDEACIEPARLGMNAILKRGRGLRAPERHQLQQVYEQVRALYTAAYEWPANDLPERLEPSGTTRMRQHIRSWITRWDLLRLYGVAAQPTLEDVPQSYEEDQDLQQ